MEAASPGTAQQPPERPGERGSGERAPQPHPDAQRWGELAVGEWIVAPSLHRLWHPERGEVALEPRVMQVLVRLAKEPGRVVSRDELIASVWPGPHVSDDAVSRCVSALRRALGDDGGEPVLLETIRKGGYRLLAPVRLLAAAQGATAGAGQAPASVAATAGEVEAGASRGRLVLGAVALAAGLAAAAVVLPRLALSPARSRSPAVSRLALRPATSHAGAELDPALSPSGRLLAYSWDGHQETGFDLYVKSLEGDTPLRLTEHAADERSPAWAPDGERLAFLRTSGEGGEILVVSVVGGPERLVTTTRIADVPDLAWSPDGRWIYFADRGGAGEPTAIFSVELASGRRRRVTAPPRTVSGDRDLALSPDGSRVAFARAMLPGVEDLWLAPGGGGPALRLTSDRASINGIEWSADGARLLVSSNRDGESRLWWVPLGGGTPSVIDELGDGVLDPSLVGDRLVFERKRFDTNLWRLELAVGGEPRPLVRSTRWDHAPAIAPDGRRVAFVTDRAGPSEVWVAELASGAARRLFSSATRIVGSPAWSPDGDHLVVAQTVGDRTELLVVSRAGAGRRLLAAPSHDVEPWVSTDGRSVLFASDRSGSWQVWRVAWTGGRAAQLTRHGGGRARRTPDGRLFFGRRAEPGIFRLDRDGGEHVVAGSESVAPGADWEIGSRFVYVRPLATEATRPRALVRIPLAGGAAEPVSPPLAGLHLAGLGLSLAPDESFLLFGRVDGDDSDLVLAEPVTPPSR